MKNGWFFLFIIPLFFLYQNCGTSLEAQSGSVESGNGNGYGGYSVNPPPSGDVPTGGQPITTEILYTESQTQTCADGSFVHATIRSRERNVYLLIRDGCIDLEAPVTIETQDLTSVDGDLIYRSRIFKRAN